MYKLITCLLNYINLMVKKASVKKAIKQKVRKELKKLTHSPEVIQQVKVLPPQQRKSFLKRLAVNVAQGVAVGLGISVTAAAAYHFVGKKMINDTVNDTVKQVKNDPEFRNLTAKINEIDVKQLQRDIKVIAEKSQDIDVKQLQDHVNSLRGKIDELDLKQLQNNINALRGKIDETDLNKLQADISGISGAAKNPVGAIFSGLFGGGGSEKPSENAREKNRMFVENIINPTNVQESGKQRKSPRKLPQQTPQDRINYLENTAIKELDNIIITSNDPNLRGFAQEGIDKINAELNRLKRSSQFGKKKFNLMSLKRDLLKLNKIF